MLWLVLELSIVTGGKGSSAMLSLIQKQLFPVGCHTFVAMLCISCTDSS